MSVQAKMNLVGILILPVVAMLTGVVMFGPRPDTVAAIFGINIVPMLIGGGISALLLRQSNRVGGAGRSIALWPTFVPAIIGIIWYLSDARFPAENDAGRVYIAVPLYLLGIVILVGIVAAIGCAIARSGRDSG